MMTTKPRILVADDEEFNLDNILFHLTEAGYDVIGAEDGAVAFEKLKSSGPVDVIVLDRIMPNMDGMELLRAIKAEDEFRDIPVVMQTAASEPEEVLEGIKAGVYYYLTKPYEQEMLLGIVGSALRDTQSNKALQESVRRNRSILGLMVNSCFRFRTLDEAKNLAAYVANCFPEPDRAIYGLHELLINAVEHGNLGITYSEKTKLIFDHQWDDDVQRRLGLAENRTKFAHISFQSTADAIVVIIKDEGDGFDWEKYLELSPDRVTDPHGRGIATSRMMSFHSLEYLGSGNEVRCTVKL
ncbi:MAG TPA: response regulator [Geobacterales bacterium]|nr:response regulator [Geobacterales bacterium]